MGEYRRFVAYVYEYQKGKKGKNCGFIRVEAKEGRCRLEAHLVCPGLTPGVKCEIFGFVRNAGLMDGSLIGSCLTGEGRTDCVLEADRDQMGNGRISLEKMGGMIFLTENGAFFGTEWDDRPIRPNNFRRMEDRGDAEQAEPERKETPEADAEEGALEESEETSRSESSQENFEEREEISEGREDRGTEMRTEDTSKKNEEALETDMEEDVLDRTGETPETGMPDKISEEDASAVEAAANEMAPESRLVVRMENDGSEKEERENSSKEALRMQEQPPLSIGEPVEAFSDGEICDCRKIRLRDLCRLYPRDCSLRGNRFLQYGFYNFGHLLLGVNSCGRYILGVPGGYDQQERFMANMFGFSYFKESDRIRLPKTKGGYWYRLINPPKLN